MWTSVLVAVVVLLALAVVFGGLLGFAAERFRVEGNPLVDQIDALLPQTQCGQCGYPGCRPYAESIAEGDRSTNARRAASLPSRHWQTCWMWNRNPWMPNTALNRSNGLR